MADQPLKNWYPTPDHPRQDTDRIIFDNLYQLRDAQAAARESTGQEKQGMSVTVVFPSPGFKVGNSTFHSMTFAGGLLVATS